MQKYRSANALVDATLNTTFFTGDKPIIPCVRKGRQGPLVVVVGPNAGGKSFFRRVVQHVCKADKIEFIGLSMEGRQSRGMFSSFVYGDETWEATGINSVKTVLTGIATCRSRQTRHAIFWDEPDIGLSDDLAASLGAEIRSFIETIGDKTVGVFVTSHNRAFVEQLVPANPIYLHVGSDKAPDTLDDWVKKPVKIRDLKKTVENAHKRFRKLQRELDRLKKL